MDTTSASTSRRRVVQGIAWAAPAVAMTAAAPAFAASKCTPTIEFSGGTWIDAGFANHQKSTQQYAFGGQVFVKNLPSDLTVLEVTEQHILENAIDQDTTGNGYWFLGNSTTNWYNATDVNKQCQNVGCSVEWTGPIGKASQVDNTTAPAPGWSSTVVNSFRLKPIEFTDGVTRPAWDVTTKWTPKDGDGLTPGTGECNDFTTGPSGRFGVNYINATTKATGSTVSMFTIVTVYLSNDTKLTYRTKTTTSVIKPLCDRKTGGCI